MNSENGAYRWWENYLVRYLMPSIAGAVIVSWLASIAGDDFKKILLIDIGSNGLQTPTLVLLFLYGNLFCYIASYPILVFHVTRVIDFEQGNWAPSAFRDGYIMTLAMGLIAIVTSYFASDSCLSKPIPFMAVSIFAFLQMRRIYIGLRRVEFDGFTGRVSQVVAYTYAMAKRRGVIKEACNIKQTTKDQKDEETGGTFDEESEWQKKSIWRKEFIDSYRHMREHGNSAFIFILELILAANCFCILSAFEIENAAFRLSAVGMLLAIWALPAMFVHFLGQHIERRFSWYDKKVTPDASDTQATRVR